MLATLVTLVLSVAIAAGGIGYLLGRHLEERLHRPSRRVIGFR